MNRSRRHRQLQGVGVTHLPTPLVLILSQFMIYSGIGKEKTCLRGFPIRSDTNRAVPPQKMA